MKVTITYYDQESLTIEEVIARAKHTYGDFVEVYVQPSSNKPADILYFALQQLITHEQLSLLFDDKHLYRTKILELRASILDKVQKELSSVIKDNEIKVT
jgi:hypothetical protein